MKGAAAAGVATVVTVGAAERATASSVTLDDSPGQGAANRTALQAAIDATPAGEVLALPDGTYEIDVSGGAITLSSSITIVAGGATTLDVLPKTTTTMNSLFKVPSTVAAGDFRFENFEIAGPTATSGGGSAIEWVRLGGVGSITAFLLRVTGQFQYGIRRSGVGLLELVACQINARGSAVQAQDNGSGAGPSRVVVVGCELSGTGDTMGKYGIDLHPHIALQCAATHFDTFDQLAINVTGDTPSSIPTWTVTDCQVVDAGLASTGLGVGAVFVRVIQTVDPAMPSRQATLRGPATFLGCDLRGAGSFTLVTTGNPMVRFQSCWFEPKAIFVTGSSSPAHLVFDDCTWKLTDTGRAAYLAGSFTGVLRIRRSMIADCGTTSNNIALYGGTVFFTDSTIDSAKTNGGVSSTSGATIASPPTLTNSGTCPASPVH